jgi:hypothetical protein
LPRGKYAPQPKFFDLPKQNNMEAHDKLHLVERFTRTGPQTLQYRVTVEDPTTWTRPWTADQEYNKQSDQQNRIYTDNRCHEGNYGMPGLLRGARTDEKAFAEGRGPNPAEIYIAPTQAEKLGATEGETKRRGFRDRKRQVLSVHHGYSAHPPRWH